MDKPLKIAMIGDGGWGSTLALLLAKKGHQVALWSPFAEYAAFLREKRENVKFLPGFRIPKEIVISSDMAQVLEGAEVVTLAVPSHFMRSVVERMKGFPLSERLVVSVSKGIENGTLLRMSEVIQDVLGRLKLAVLSGPTIAPEVARGLPAMAVAASDDDRISARIQGVFNTDTFGVYRSDDLIGVELGGALKNVIAIAAGISDGLKLGTNTKAALFTRGLVEMARLGVKMGARMETFSGLSGMGDLVTTCLSPESRNRSFGEKIGRGGKVEEILKETEQVVEGVRTTLSAVALGKRNGKEMPITLKVKEILYDGKDPQKAVKELMERPRDREQKQ